MAKRNRIDLSDLEKYVNKYAQNVARIAAGKIRDELTEEARVAIEDFYKSYTPNYYYRHYYNFRKNSFKKYYKNSHNTVYYGGVELTPNELDEVYQDPASQVFDTVFAGFHGPASMIGGGYAANGGEPKFYNHMINDYSTGIPDRMWPSPMERLFIKQEEIENNIEKYIEDAQNTTDAIMN